MHGNLKKGVENARKCENLNDPVDTYFVDYIAMVFSGLFIKLHIIPNVVTVLSGIVGVTGGVLLCFNTLLTDILGVILIFLSAVLDASDGQVARLTKRYSNFGRTLDGFADFLVYLSVYVALCVRLYPVNIPFTETPWGIWIIPVAAVTFYFFGAQARTADYCKNLHMFMSKNGKGNELSRSHEIESQTAAQKRFSFERLRLKTYLAYTKTQERETPKTQKLLRAIEKNGDVPSDPLSDAFTAESRKHVRFTNVLTFNLRTIVLFVLLFMPWHLELLYFPFVVFVLEPVRIAIIVRYEKLSASLIKQNFFTVTESDK